jgi:anti-sigma B factor antagonist
LTATEPITTSVGYRDGIAVLAVGGEIDLMTAPILQSAIDDVLADSPVGLIIDFSTLEFLASVGLRILVDTHQRLLDTAYFAVVADGSATSRPIRLTNLDEVFALYPTVDEAIAARVRLA